ncbi:isochorismatase family protein [Pirellulaceae bacterium]|jgi:type 1 glutamine amidotransferase/nicotinamidase-related amidase|nr:isochorismatase family protein [Pirellulaceae bacterium]
MRWCYFLLLGVAVTFSASAAERSDFKLTLRSQAATSDENIRFQARYDQQQWKASETAVIVCDMWNLHHCLNATRRGTEMAPRLNQLLIQSRRQGALIIHAPSSCMEPYKDHPARARALNAPAASNLPAEIGKWCYSIPSEEKGTYPIDQTDGGEDDDLEEHAAWAKKLTGMGLNPRSPWTKQTDLVDILDKDVISDNGEEIWNVLQQAGIKNVVLVGVHTNMCVLGRPFGLRQMAQNGMNVVLCRDLTDTMYNPKMKPFVSHFTGTDLIVEHIEKWVCPTITSDQILGGKPFVYATDTRKHVVILIAEREYRTNESLPRFALEHLGKDYKVTIVHCDEDGQGERNALPNSLPAITQADLLLISIRRRVLPQDQLQAVRRHIENGKPVVGIRTANHAFSLRGESPPEGLVAWEKFDQEIWGGNYANHHGNGKTTTIAALCEHEILNGVDLQNFTTIGSLYQVNPLASSTQAILSGTIPDKPMEPIAWTNKTIFGGRAFYTSLGHIKDFDTKSMNVLLKNAIAWALNND